MYVSIGVFKLLSVHVLTLWLCAQQVSSQQASACSRRVFVCRGQKLQTCKVVLHLSMYLLLTYLSTYISYSFVYLFNF